MSIGIAELARNEAEQLAERIKSALYNCANELDQSGLTEQQEEDIVDRYVRCAMKYVPQMLERARAEPSPCGVSGHLRQCVHGAKQYCFDNSGELKWAHISPGYEDCGPQICTALCCRACLREQEARLSAALARTEQLIETLQSNKLDDALYADSWTEYIDLMCEKMRIAPLPADLTDALERVNGEAVAKLQSEIADILCLEPGDDADEWLVPAEPEPQGPYTFTQAIRNYVALQQKFEEQDVARIQREARAEVIGRLSQQSVVHYPLEDRK